MLDAGLPARCEEAQGPLGAAVTAIAGGAGFAGQPGGLGLGHEGGAALLGQGGGDARVLDHRVLLGEFLWLQPALRQASGHPCRPRNCHPITTEPARIGEDRRVGDSYAAGMSQREAEVLEMLGAHLSNAQIAGRLHISVRTVESHVSSLLRKFGVADRRELAELAQTVLAAATRASRAARSGCPRSGPASWAGTTSGTRILAALKTSRLVSLLGPGGVGKTRLAVEVAREAASAYPSGCAFVDLVPVAEEFVTQAVATLLGVTEEPGQLLDEAVLDHLAAGRWLLVLDNCEHLLAVAAAFAERLLAACPGVTVLATSRERLGVPGERSVPVQPLSLRRDRRRRRSPRRRRCSSTGPGRLTPDFAADRTALGELCARLDGMPLAIELAAARSASLGLAGLRSGLDDRLRLLAGGRGGDAAAPFAAGGHRLESRHCSTTRNGRVFRRLSVFVGGFDLDAASADRVRRRHRGALADLVGRLADKSLLASADGQGGRWRMLETVRAYALEQLAGQRRGCDDQRTAPALGGGHRGQSRAPGRDGPGVAGQLRPGGRRPAGGPGASAGAGPDDLVTGWPAASATWLMPGVSWPRRSRITRLPRRGRPIPARRGRPAGRRHVALAAGRGDTAFGLMLEAAVRASEAGDNGAWAAALAYAVSWPTGSRDGSPTGFARPPP